MNALKEIRRAKRRTQSELAEALGVTLQAYSQMERRWPSLQVDNFQAIATALGVDVVLRIDGTVEFREPEPWPEPDTDMELGDLD